MSLWDDLNDPIGHLHHAVVMIEHNKDHENVKELYEDALWLINHAIVKLQEERQIRISKYET